MGVNQTPATTRLDAAGNIKGSAGKLLWIQVSNTTGGGLKCILNNHASDTSNEILQIGVPADDSKFIAFVPPLYFSTAIRVGTVESGLIVTGGYE